jgi:hypothetical protein
MEKETRKMVKPITPEEITTTKEDLIPDEVIESFNEMIVAKWNGTESFFRLKEITTVAKRKLNLRKPKKEFDSKWLDVEDIYRRLGWNVVYMSPDWGEDYDAYFTFSKKDKK